MDNASLWKSDSAAALKAGHIVVNLTVTTANHKIEICQMGW